MQLASFHRLRSVSIFELDALAASGINHTATIRSALLLVLLLCEAFAACDDQVGVRAVGVVVGHVGVAGEFGVDDGVGFDALEAVLDMVLLCFGCVCGG